MARARTKLLPLRPLPAILRALAGPTKSLWHQPTDHHGHLGAAPLSALRLLSHVGVAAGEGPPTPPPSRLEQSATPQQLAETLARRLARTEQRPDA